MEKEVFIRHALVVIKKSLNRNLPDDASEGFMLSRMYEIILEQSKHILDAVEMFKEE